MINILKNYTLLKFLQLSLVKNFDRGIRKLNYNMNIRDLPKK